MCACRVHEVVMLVSCSHLILGIRATNLILEWRWFSSQTATLPNKSMLNLAPLRRLHPHGHGAAANNTHLPLNLASACAHYFASHRLAYSRLPTPKIKTGLSYPASRTARAASKCPSRHARCSGDAPHLSPADTSAPLRAKRLTMSADPA